MPSRFVTLAVVRDLVHLAVNLAHGWAHFTIPVPNTPAQNAFIIPVIGIAPLVAAWLVVKGRTSAGAALLALAVVEAAGFLIGALGFVRGWDAGRGQSGELTRRAPGR